MYCITYTRDFIFIYINSACKRTQMRKKVIVGKIFEVRNRKTKVVTLGPESPYFGLAHMLRGSLYENFLMIGNGISCLGQIAKTVTTKVVCGDSSNTCV